MKHYSSFLNDDDEINREDMYSSFDELEDMHSELDDADYDTDFWDNSHEIQLDELRDEIAIASAALIDLIDGAHSVTDFP